MKHFLLSTVIGISLISCQPIKQNALDVQNFKADSTRIADSLMNVILTTQTPSAEIWEVNNYVDEFGEPTKQKYITNSDIILGLFSNSATENSELHVKFLIDGLNSITIQLFEYGGTNPVKNSLEQGYKIKVRSGSNDIVVLRANNYSDRLSLNKSDSKILSDLLLKGGKLQFSIIEISEYTSSSYKFEIEDAKGYGEAIKKLTE